MNDNIRKVEMSPEFVKIIEMIIKQNAMILEVICNPQFIIKPKPQETE